VICHLNVTETELKTRKRCFNGRLERVCQVRLRPQLVQTLPRIVHLSARAPSGDYRMRVGESYLGILSKILGRSAQGARSHEGLAGKQLQLGE
jgi:hypothetical protein